MCDNLLQWPWCDMIWSVCLLGLPRVLEYSSTTQVVNYSSNFLLLEYSLISISGCKFPFPDAVFAVQTAVNWRIVGIYGNLGLRDFICNLPACGNISEYTDVVKALIKYEVKQSRLFKAWPFRLRCADLPPLIRHWQLVLKYFQY